METQWKAREDLQQHVEHTVSDISNKMEPLKTRLRREREHQELVAPLVHQTEFLPSISASGLRNNRKLVFCSLQDKLKNLFESTHEQNEITAKQMELKEQELSLYKKAYEEIQQKLFVVREEVTLQNLVVSAGSMTLGQVDLLKKKISCKSRDNGCKDELTRTSKHSQRSRQHAQKQLKQVRGMHMNNFEKLQGLELELSTVRKQVQVITGRPYYWNNEHQ